MSDYFLSSRSDRKMACWLMLLLAALYLCFFSGRFHSLDEIRTVALTESLLTESRTHSHQISWAETWPLPLGSDTQDGMWDSTPRVVWSLLIAPWQQLAYWLAGLDFLPDVGVVGLVMLSNWGITTLTGGLLYLLARRLGYPPVTGVVVTLAWGAGTLALVYSKLLSPQPVVALGLLVVINLAMLASRDDARRSNPPKTTEVVTTGILFALFLLAEGRLLFYMPLLLPAWWGICGWLGSSSRRRRVGWLVVGLSVANFVLLRLAAEGVDAPNGGIGAWVPLLPLWCLGLAPCWQSRRARWPLVFIMALSFLIQLPNLLIDFNSPVMQELSQNSAFSHHLWTLTDEVPLVDYAPLLANRQAWDIAWVATGSWYLGGGIFLLCLAALYGAKEALTGMPARPTPSPSPNNGRGESSRSVPSPIIGRGESSRPSPIIGRGVGGRAGRHAREGLFSAFLLLFVVLTQTTAYDDPQWSAYHADLGLLVRHLKVAPPDSRLLFEMHAYHDYIDRVQAWLNLNHSGVPQVQLLQQNELDERRTDLLERTMEEAKWIYLATEGTSPGDPTSGTERWLSQHAFLARDEWVGPYTRLTVFYSTLAASLQPVVTSPLSLADDLLLLEASTNVRHDDQHVIFQPGDPLLISLEWQAKQVPEANYIIFVQLLGPQGVVAEQNGWPQANFAPTSSWQVGQPVTDKRALIVPNLPAGDYSLIAGMFDTATRQRLAVGDGEQHTISLGVVRVAFGAPP